MSNKTFFQRIELAGWQAQKMTKLKGKNKLPAKSRLTLSPKNPRQ